MLGCFSCVWLFYIQMATWKETQHCSLLEKCTSKLQWYITSHQSEWPSPKKSTSNSWLRGCGKKGTLLLCWWEYKLIQSLWRTVWRVLKKLRIKLPYDSAVLLLSTYSAWVLSCFQLFVTPKTVVHQASLSMGLFWKEYWSRLPFFPPGGI